MADFLKTKFDIEKIILFGSYAYGEPVNDSDVDLFIVIKTDLKPVKQAVLIKKELNEKFGIKFPMDIIVRTPEFVQKRQNEDFF
ncbi:MAG: nucleotidyltransferase domain-containing protein [Candidatus Goldbacteria bacterium]|nr:nucleotidyltransferase domain-containing protein [Candidatus Goldiibacteriota bacterium]